MKTIEIHMLYEGQRLPVELKLKYDNAFAYIKLVNMYDSEFKFKASGTNYFEALCNLREQIEPLGYLLCINGSRLDFYPSNMTLQMSLGLIGYEIVFGHQGRNKINTFDECLDNNKLAIVVEQKKYFSNWVKSL